MNTHRFVLFALLMTLTVASRAAEPAALRLVQTITLPGVAGRFDHFACDPAEHRLVVAALGNDTAEVLDLTNFVRLKSIARLSKPTGVLILPEWKRVFIANGTEGRLQSFDTVSYESAAKIGGLDDADNVRFDRGAKLIYVGFGDGALGIVDPTTNRLIRHIPLPAHPESFQLEANGPRIFVNLPDAKQIAVVNRAKMAIVAIWPMEKWRANFPMALDETHHRIFVGCRSPARLVVIDTEKGTPVSDFEISGDTDDLFYDAKRERVYVSCGEGFIDVIQVQAGDRYERVTRIPTRGGARTGFFSPELDRFFLAVPTRGGNAAEIRIYQPQ